MALQKSCDRFCKLLWTLLRMILLLTFFFFALTFSDWLSVALNSSSPFRGNCLRFDPMTSPPTLTTSVLSIAYRRSADQDSCKGAHTCNRTPTWTHTLTPLRHSSVVWLVTIRQLFLLSCLAIRDVRALFCVIDWRLSVSCLCGRYDEGVSCDPRLVDGAVNLSLTSYPAVACRQKDDILKQQTGQSVLVRPQEQLYCSLTLDDKFCGTLLEVKNITF